MLSSVSTFAGQMLFEYLEDRVGFDAPFNDIIFLGMTLAIILFFRHSVAKIHYLKKYEP